jgi:hypothetical protein
MSATKAWLADTSHYSDESKRMMSDPTLSAAFPNLRNMVIRDRMTCADGFSLSIQYSPGHYCNGRERFLGGDMKNRDDPLPEPRTVEVGFPSEPEPLLAPYAEEAKRLYLSGNFKFVRSLEYSQGWRRWLAKVWPKVSNLTETVYAQVPVEVVDQVIAKHGGVAGEE